MSTSVQRRATVASASLVLLGALLFPVSEQALPPPAALPPSVSLAPPDEGKELVVLMQPGPATYFPADDGEPSGLDVDLLRLFAQHKKLVLRLVLVGQPAQLLLDIEQGLGHIGAGGLSQPVAASLEGFGTALKSFDDSFAQSSAFALWTSSYYSVGPLLIDNSDGFKPGAWAASSADTDSAFRPATTHRELAWAVAPHFATLRDELDVFLARQVRDGTLNRLADRYFLREQPVSRIDAGIFQDRLRTVLPRYRRLLQDAEEATGLDWRLLAAVAYQESQWDPLATSETGAHGLMQLTEETARHLNVADRSNPKASIAAAARYLQTLKQKMPARIREPNRTWFALAAFNIGIAHLEDARVLAQKQKLDPDVWNDVRKTLPLLAEPEYHVDAKYGYARGGMPVAFVDRVRAYYDILLAQQRALPSRLHLASVGG